jgi:hypothetical protein
MIASLLVAIEMALELRVDVLFTEQIDQPFGGGLCVLDVINVSGVDRGRDWTIKAAGQTDQALGMCGQLVSSNTVLTWFCVFRHTQFHEGD